MRTSVSGIAWVDGVPVRVGGEIPMAPQLRMGVGLVGTLSTENVLE